jgi:hypothetical protein
MTKKSVLWVFQRNFQRNFNITSSDVFPLYSHLNWPTHLWPWSRPLICHLSTGSTILHDDPASLDKGESRVGRINADQFSTCNIKTTQPVLNTRPLVISPRHLSLQRQIVWRVCMRSPQENYHLLLFPYHTTQSKMYTALGTNNAELCSKCHLSRSWDSFVIL